MAVNEEEDAEGICERLLPASSASDTDHANQGDRVFWKVTFLAGAAVASLFSGIGFNLVLSGPLRQTTPGGKRKGGVVYEDPVRLATRAFAWGSLYAIVGVGSISFAAWLFLRRWDRYTRFHMVQVGVVRADTDGEVTDQSYCQDQDS